jgi:hypothetical protein
LREGADVALGVTHHDQRHAGRLAREEGSNFRQSRGRAKRRRRPAQHALELGLQAVWIEIVRHRLAPHGVAEIGGAIRYVVQDALRDRLIIHPCRHAVQHTPGACARHLQDCGFWASVPWNRLPGSIERAGPAAIEPNCNGGLRFRFNSPGSERAARVPKVKLLYLTLLVALVSATSGALAQTIEIRQWQGTNAYMRQPDQVVASSMAEWRSLWARVGARAPDVFEPGRTNAVGIFLGQRGPGHAINVLTAVRRRDRIMLVFEERGPNDFMTAQRMQPQPTSRALSTGPSFGGAASSFAPPGASFAAPAGPPSVNRPPPGPPTSPWAIVLINRADLPVTVEQRLFR